MEKLKHTPSLRFSEFQGEWEMNYGNSVFSTISNKNHNSDLPILAISQEYGAVPREMINYQISVTDKSVDSYKIVEIGDFIISLRSFQGGIEYSNYLGICSPAYIILRPKVEICNKYFKYFFKTDNYISLLCKKLEGIRDGKMISYKYFSEILLPFPNIKEQIKIASFITAVDDKLQALKQKKTLLEQYKKGVMQKIFSQELRFKNENENEYPDWEKKMLGDFGETYNGLTGKTKEHFGNGKPYIQYKQIFYDSKIDISRFEFVQISSSENQNKVVFGDVFFTVSSETPNEIGTASVLLNDVEELYLNSFCFGYRASKSILSPYFSRYLFRNELFRNQIIKLAQGSTRYNMSKVQLMKLTVKLPCLEEQTKIGNFLATIDDKINHCNLQIKKTELWKKGLLQQMFV